MTNEANFFPIFEITDENAAFPEQLGTKEKIWISHMGELKLLKFGREGTGEDWAEKVACELCGLLGLPHAHYDLATYQGRSCVISPSIIEEDGRLILGNEIINRVSSSYNGARAYQQKEHTVSRVLAALKTNFRSQYYEIWHDFIGYLLLDAWIGNSDRHHENWGIILRKDRTLGLAPSFDHASSMGRELTDEARLARLETKDLRYSVAAFASKAKSALYADPSDTKPLAPIEAFKLASRAQRASGFAWLGRLAAVTDDALTGVLDRVPNHCMSNPSKRFAAAILSENRAALTAMLKAGN